MNQPQLFESTPEGKRRSVLFSLTVITGFITVVAGVATWTATSQRLLGLVLGLIGVGAFGLAVLLSLGYCSRLVDDEQLLWRLTE